MSEALGLWLATGRPIDLVLLIVALEVLLVALWRRSRGTPLSPAELVGPVLAGVLLMLALRVALVGGAPELVVLFLAASFPAHLFDLKRRMGQVLKSQKPG
jgi:hypothetical protein